MPSLRVEIFGKIIRTSFPNEAGFSGETLSVPQLVA